jgi:hypothetical protein
MNKPSRDYANHNNHQYRPNAYNSVNSGPNIQEPQNNHSVVTNNESMINTIQDESVYKKRQRESPQGRAIFNYTQLNYLCDSGAAKTIISEEAFKRIQADDPKVKLKPYRGSALTSANKPLVIVGTVQLKACTFSHAFKIN